MHARAAECRASSLEVEPPSKSSSFSAAAAAVTAEGSLDAPPTPAPATPLPLPPAATPAAEAELFPRGGFELGGGWAIAGTSSPPMSSSCCSPAPALNSAVARLSLFFLSLFVCAVLRRSSAIRDSFSRRSLVLFLSPCFRSFSAAFAAFSLSASAASSAAFLATSEGLLSRFPGGCGGADAIDSGEKCAYSSDDDAFNDDSLLYGVLFLLPPPAKIRTPVSVRVLPSKKASGQVRRDSVCPFSLTLRPGGPLCVFVSSATNECYDTERFPFSLRRLHQILLHRWALTNEIQKPQATENTPPVRRCLFQFSKLPCPVGSSES